MTTPDRDTLLALAAKVEAATGPDRELDALIWLTVTPGATRRETVIPPNERRKGWTIDETRDASGRLIVVPAYTALLDAAMSLVPEGWTWLIRSPNKASGKCFARLESADFDSVTYGKGETWLTDTLAGQEAMANVATPPLALTAASLRALAARAKVAG